MCQMFGTLLGCHRLRLRLKLEPGRLTIFGMDISVNKKMASLVAGQIMDDGKDGVGVIAQFESQVAP